MTVSVPAPRRCLAHESTVYRARTVRSAEALPAAQPAPVVRGRAGVCYGAWSSVEAMTLAIARRSSAPIGHSTSQGTQYASIVWFVSSNLAIARRVYPFCDRCEPQAGQVETKVMDRLRARSPRLGSGNASVAVTSTRASSIWTLPIHTTSTTLVNCTSTV